MKLNVPALGLAGAILWGACVLLVGLANMAVPGYGAAFLAVVASIYPGFHAAGNFLNLLLRTAFALVDGAIAGAIIVWLYNAVANTRPRTAPSAREVAHDLRHPAH